MNQIGIVGCGITGAVVAMLLKQRLPHLNVTIFEKSRGTGGRMTTSRNSKGNSVDLGAQFITKTSNLTSIQERCYTELLEAKLLEPLSEIIEGIRSTPSTCGHFVCPKGSGSLVKYFLQQSGCKTLFNHKVVKLNSSSQKWLMECDNGSSHELDAVILTLPVPQILQLDGLSTHLKDHIEELKAVKYCSRYALGLFYDTNPEYFKDMPQGGKFIPNHPCIRYYSLNKKSDNAPPSLVIHTTKEFGNTYLENPDLLSIQNLIMKQFDVLHPLMPKPSEIKLHKWRYSQVETNFQKSKGSLLLAKEPSLICGGDSFSFSTFEGCILSAENIVCNYFNLK